MMEAVELAEPPSAARRRLSATLGAGVVDKRRGSLLALEHPSVLEPEPVCAGDATEEKPQDEAEPKGKKRASIISRRASTISRVLAFSTTAKSFHEERILATKINAMIWLDEPDPDVDKLRRTLAERLLAIPRFRCVVRNGEKGSVVFEPLARSEVKIDEHIVHVDGGSNFGPYEVQELINEAYLSQWHSDMPLWRMSIVTNTGDGRSLLFASVDHAIGDGAGLLSVFLSLFDDESPGRDDSKGSKESNPMVGGEKRTPKGLSRSHRFVAVMKGIWAGVVTTFFGPPVDVMSALKIPNSKLSEPSLGKDFAQTRAFSLEEIKTMKDKLRGATVNDVVVALLAMAITRYLKARGDDAADRGTIRASMPINMRKSGSDGLGNDFVVAFTPLPVASKDPVDCVWRAKTYIDELKLSPAFSIIQWLNQSLLHSLPPTLMAGMLLDAFTRPTCMISNVIGPQGKASIGGYPVDDLNFTVSFPNNLYFGVLSFGGTLRISGILDRKTGGELDELMDCIEDSYDELQAALEGVDEKEPIERPDSTPLRAKILEVLFFVTVVALPVLVARKFAM